MSKNIQNYSQTELAQIANSPAAQQLIQLLKSSDPQAISAAVSRAAAGDSEGAIASLKKIISENDIKAVMKNLGGELNGRSGK